MTASNTDRQIGDEFVHGYHPTVEAVTAMLAEGRGGIVSPEAASGAPHAQQSLEAARAQLQAAAEGLEVRRREHSLRNTGGWFGWQQVGVAAEAASGVVRESEWPVALPPLAELPATIPEMQRQSEVARQLDMAVGPDNWSINADWSASLRDMTNSQLADVVRGVSLPGRTADEQPNPLGEAWNHATEMFRREREAETEAGQQALNQAASARTQSPAQETAARVNREFAEDMTAFSREYLNEPFQPLPADVAINNFSDPVARRREAERLRREQGGTQTLGPGSRRALEVRRARGLASQIRRVASVFRTIRTTLMPRHPTSVVAAELFRQHTFGMHGDIASAVVGATYEELDAAIQILTREAATLSASGTVDPAANVVNRVCAALLTVREYTQHRAGQPQQTQYGPSIPQRVMDAVARATSQEIDRALTMLSDESLTQTIGTGVDRNDSGDAIAAALAAMSTVQQDRNTPQAANPRPAQTMSTPSNRREAQDAARAAGNAAAERARMERAVQSLVDQQRAARQRTQRQLQNTPFRPADPRATIPATRATLANGESQAAAGAGLERRMQERARRAPLDWESTTVWYAPDNATGQFVPLEIATMAPQSLYETIEWATHNVLNLYGLYEDERRIQGNRNAGPALAAKEWLATRPVFRTMVQEAVRKRVAFSDHTCLYIRQFLLSAAPPVTRASAMPWADSQKLAEQQDLQEFINHPAHVVTEADVAETFGRRSRAIKLD